MSKKATALFALAVSGSILPISTGLAVAAEPNNPTTDTANVWQVPNVTTVDQDNKTIDGVKYDVVVETRADVHSDWVNKTATQKVEGTDAQKIDQVYQAQKLVGTPNAVKAETKEESLTRITYKEANTVNGFDKNDSTVVLYETNKGWVVDDSDKDAIKNTTFESDSDTTNDTVDPGLVSFINNKTVVKESPKTDVKDDTTVKSTSTTPAPKTEDVKKETDVKATVEVSQGKGTVRHAPTIQAPKSEVKKAETKEETKKPLEKVSSESVKANPSANIQKQSLNAPTLPNVIPAKASGTFAQVDSTAFSIHGKVFTDSNKNNEADPDEKPVVGTTVTLRNGDDNSVVKTTKTDASGNYRFDGIDQGNYSVYLADDSSVSSVWGNDQAKYASVILTGGEYGQKDAEIDFGVVPGSKVDSASTNKSDSSKKNNKSSDNSTKSSSSSGSTQGTDPLLPTLDNNGNTSNNSDSTTSPSSGSSDDSSTATNNSDQTNTDSSSTTDDGTNQVNSGALPNKTNNGALAMGIGFIGLAGAFARKTLKRVKN